VKICAICGLYISVRRRFIYIYGIMKRITAFAVLAALFSCNGDKPSETDSVPTIPAPASINYTVVKMYPHDTTSYTQGLEWQDNTLYEGSGDPDKKGVSKLAKVDLATGKDLKRIGLTSEFFGEGITLMNGKIYQLTWQQHKVFVYDATSFKKIKEFAWPFEGWGLTHNDSSLIISTGGSNIYFVDPETFAVKRTLGVSDNNGYVDSINELEYVDGYVYANVYGRDYIIKINPSTGSVDGRIDLSNIMAKNGVAYDPPDGYVLNGIAYNKDTKSFYVTGKRWPNLFEIKLN
jgi:glutamine cyclotransferase